MQVCNRNDILIDIEDKDPRDLAGCDASLAQVVGRLVADGNVKSRMLRSLVLCSHLHDSYFYF